MSDDEKPPKVPPARQRAKPRGKDSPRNDVRREKLLSPRMLMAARAAYEGDLKATYKQVAREFGISATSLERIARDQCWVKCVDSNPKMTNRAHLIADKASKTLADMGPVISAAGTDDERAEVLESAQTEITTEAGADVRAKILERHRKEWAAPRKLSYEAISDRDFERAKLAKITSETLKIIQDGERKAWGIDSGSESSVTVVIERE